MVPPNIAAMLQEPDTGGPPGPDALVGGPSGPPTGSLTSRDDGSDLDHIRTAIHALQIYAEGNHDDQELHAVQSCIVNLQKILASHAKNADAALGTTPAMKHIRRVSGRTY
jgi:hypothetical protein